MVHAHSAFRGRSRGTLATLAAILVGFAVLTSWNIGRQDYALYYASAARSMATSWRAFIFGAFDPSATVTLDKLSGFLVPQALSARLFGFHPWSLALPQVVEGVLTVAACYVIGARWRGAKVGLLAAAAAATTPLLAAMFGHPMEDGLLTMALAGAFVCWQAAVRSGRLLPLIGAGLLVGVGFQAKMAQAWLILPALVIGYLLARRPPRGARLVRTGVLLGVALIASLAWTAAIQLVPADRRPYVDGTTDNNMFTMVLGFNGLDRVLPGSVPGAVATGPHGRPTPTSLALGTNQTVGLLKLVGLVAVSQVGWLYPLGAAGLVGALVDDRPAWRRPGRRGRAGTAPEPGPGAGQLPAVDPTAAPPAAGVDPAVTDPSGSHRATTVALLLWLVVAAALLSVARVPHTAYLAAISVPLAVLVGTGLRSVLAALRSGSTRARRWALVALLVQVCWAGAVLIAYGPVPGAMVAVLVGAGVLAMVAALYLARRSRPAGAPRAASRPGLVRAAAALVVVGTLLTPAAWAAQALDAHQNGSSSDAYAGPREPLGLGPGAFPHAVRFTVSAPWQVRDPGLSASGRALAAYLRRTVPHPTGSVLLTDYWGSAASLVVLSGLDVRAAGGFSGQVPDVRPAALAAQVRAGRLPFALIHDRPSALVGHLPRIESAVVRADAQVIRDHCRAVPRRAWDAGHPIGGMTLFDCRR